MTKVYVLQEYADFGEDGTTHHIMGCFSTPELALVEVQREHHEHSYTGWGLRDFRLYEVEVDKPDSHYSWDYYKTFKLSNTLFNKGRSGQL